MKAPPTSYKNVILIVFFLLLIPSVTQAQTDTRFWFAAPDVSVGHGDNPIRIVVSAFDVAATVTVTQPANLAFPTYIVNVAANSSEVIDIQPSITLVETPYDAPGLPISVSTTGLLVESTAKITAYYEVNNYTNNDIFALKGKNGLGIDFYVPFQNSWNHQQGLAPNGRSGFIVVATEDATTITVTPTRNLEGGQLAGIPFNVTLNRGETYVGSVNQPLAGGFPTGTHITSTLDKPIAVTKFSDSMNSGEGGCYDLAGDQLVPVNIVGTDYVVLRGRLGVGSGSPAGNPELVVVTATQANTEVRVNGVLVTTLVLAGDTYTHTLPTAGQQIFVNTTFPAYVGHYAGYGCETGFALLPPVNCTGSLTTRIVRSAANAGDDFTINLMTRGTLVGGSPLPNSYNFTNNFTIRVTSGGVTTTLFSPSTTPFPAVFTQVGSSIYYGTQYTFGAEVPADAVVTVESTSISVNDPAGLFHLGFVNGGAGSGTRYGYFSDFRSLDLGSDVNISYGTNTIITADIAATNFEWFADGVSVQNGASNTYTVTNIQRRQTIRVEATVGDCVLSDEICVGTLEYVWDGSIITPGDLFPDIDNPDNWSKPCGLSGVPSCNIDIIIPPTPVATSVLTIPNGKILNVRNISILSELGINGNLNVNTGGQVNVCGDMVHNGTLTMSPNSTFRFIGTGRQDYSKGTTGLGDFENLYIDNTIATSTFNNVSGVTILSSSVQDLSVSATGTLNFVQGYIVPEGFVNSSLAADPSRSVVIKNPDPTAITGFAGAGATTLPTNYFIAGKLNRSRNATGTYPFPVGLVLQEPSIIAAEPNKDGAMLNFENDDWQNPVSYGILPCDPSPNGALRMNGTSNNEYVDFGVNTTNIGVAGSASRTVEIWANVTSFNGAGLFQFGNHDLDGNPATSQSADFALVTGTTNNDWTIRIDNGFVLELINLPNSLNTWHHYALSYNEVTQQLIFYYDGIRIRTYDLPTPLGTFLTYGHIGRWSGTNTLAMRGQVDELKVWSEVRTPTQITESFAQGCAANALQCPQANNLRAYYNFQDGIINGNGTRTVQSRTIQCPVPTFTYQRADVEFNSASTVDNVTGSFKEYNTLPNPVTGQTNICGVNFDTEPALDNGFWNFSSFDGAVPTPINATYEMYLFNRDFGNDGSGSTTVMKLEPTENPYGLTPPWIIPVGLCEANTAIFTGRSGFVGNMGFFATAQSLDITLLPIELLSLTAKAKENSILVEWATLQEKDNYGFDVFRAEENGEFVKIGFVASKKQGQSEQSYNFLDVEIQPNVNYYYKLKQIDNTGKFSFTKTVMAKLSDSDFTGEQINTIYPNPTDDEFTLYLGGKEFKNSTQVQITLVNAIGEQLETKIINTQSSNRINFKLTRYPKGIYLLRIVSESSSAILKVVKE